MPNAKFGTLDALSSVSVIGTNPKEKETYMKETRQENFLGTVEEDMRKIGAHLALDMADLKINFDRSDTGGKTGSSIKVDSKGCDL